METGRYRLVKKTYSRSTCSTRSVHSPILEQKSELQFDN